MSKIFTKIVGQTFIKDGEQKLSALVVGETLELEREPDNNYDKNAIKVIGKGEKVGFINADAARSLAERLDGGEKFRCIVEQVTGGGTKHVGCNISLESTSIDSPAPRTIAESTL